MSISIYRILGIVITSIEKNGKKRFAEKYVAKKFIPIPKLRKGVPPPLTKIAETRNFFSNDVIPKAIWMSTVRESKWDLLVAQEWFTAY